MIFCYSCAQQDLSVYFLRNYFWSIFI